MASPRARYQNVTDVRPTNWDEQLDSLLTDLNSSTPKARPAAVPTRPAAPLAVTSAGREVTLPGSEDFHERQEYTSPDQRTRTIEERSRKSARTDGGSQTVTQQMYKSQSSSGTHPVGSTPALVFDAPVSQTDGTALDNLLDQVQASGKSSTMNSSTTRPHIDGSAAGPPDLSRQVPDINEPVAPGQMRITKYEYRSSSSKQRSVSPQPAPAALPKPTPPPVLPKPALVRAAPQPAPPSPDPARTHTNVAQLGGAPATLDRTPLPPPGELGSGTTINYHIYNYGTAGPDGPPAGSVDGVERREVRQTTSQHPGAPQGRPWTSAGPDSNVSSVKTYESRQTTSGQPGSPQARPWAPTGPDSNVSSVKTYESRQTTSGQPGSPQARPWASTGPDSNVSSAERYESRQTTSGQPGSPQGRPWAPTGPDSNVSNVERYESRQTTSGQPGSPQARPWAPTGPDSNVSNVERYESRQTTSGQPGSPQARPWAPTGPDSNVSSVERYESRQTTSDGGQARSPSPYDTPHYSSAPAERYHTRTVTTEVERTRTGPDGSQPFPVASDTTRDDGRPLALVPSKPQDGTYPDGPRRRDLGSGQQVQNGEGTLVPVTQGHTQTTPGVYYPPSDADCETKFQTSESHKNGNTKTKFKSEGRYKAKGGSKQKEDKGGKTIPICLPLCGGAACSIL